MKSVIQKPHSRQHIGEQKSNAIHYDGRPGNEWHRQKLEAMRANAPKTSPSDEDAKLLAEMLRTGTQSWTEPIAEPPPIIQGVLRQGELCCLAAPSKLGKTWSLMHMAQAFARGGTWMGMEFWASSVLYLNYELFAGTFDFRMQQVAKIAGAKHASEWTNRIFALHLRGLRMGAQRLLDAIQRALQVNREVSPSVMIFDPLYRFYEGKDENSNSDMAELILGLQSFAEDNGMSLIYADHHPKGTREHLDSVDQMSGGSAKGRVLDSLINLTRLDVGDAKEFIYRVQYKTRSFAEPPTQYYRLLDHCKPMEELEEVDVNALIEKAASENKKARQLRSAKKREDKMEADDKTRCDRILKWMERLANPVSMADMLRKDGGIGIGEHVLRRCLEQLVEVGKVKEDEGPRNKKTWTLA